MSGLCVCAFPDERAPAGRLAQALGAPLNLISPHRFPDGESRPRAPSETAETTVLYRSLDHPNEKLVDLLLAADALRRVGARRLILVAPYFCYLRQDKVFEPGEPLSRDVIAPLIGRAFDGVMTVQAHLHRTPDLTRALGVPAMNLMAIEPLAGALPAYDPPPVVVGPDAESAPWARAWAERLGGEAVSFRKTRSGDRSIALDARGADVVKGRAAVVIDDVAASGETLFQAVDHLRRAGAASIDIAVAHALMSREASDRLTRAGARRIVSTDSVEHPTNAAALAPVLAEAVIQMSASL